MVVFAHQLRAQYTSIGLSMIPSRSRSTSCVTKVTFTGEYTGTAELTEIVTVRFVRTPSPVGEGTAIRSVAVRSGRRREIVAPP